MEVMEPQIDLKNTNVHIVSKSLSVACHNNFCNDNGKFKQFQTATSTSFLFLSKDFLVPLKSRISIFLLWTVLSIGTRVHDRHFHLKKNSLIQWIFTEHFFSCGSYFIFPEAHTLHHDRSATWNSRQVGFWGPGFQALPRVSYPCVSSMWTSSRLEGTKLTGKTGDSASANDREASQNQESWHEARGREDSKWVKLPASFVG